MCLVDLHLKNEDGLRLAGEIEGPGRVMLKIIVITGYPSYESAIDAMKTGIFDYISKSTDNDAILRKIHAAVEERRAGAGPGKGRRPEHIRRHPHRPPPAGPGRPGKFFQGEPGVPPARTYHSYEYINKERLQPRGGPAADLLLLQPGIPAMTRRSFSPASRSSSPTPSR